MRPLHLRRDHRIEEQRGITGCTGTETPRELTSGDEQFKASRCSKQHCDGTKAVDFRHRLGLLRCCSACDMRAQGREEERRPGEAKNLEQKPRQRLSYLLRSPPVNKYVECHQNQYRGCKHRDPLVERERVANI